MVAVLQPRPRPSSSSAAPMKGGKGQRERTPPPQRRETKGKSDRKGGKGKGKGEGKNRLMDDWDKSWFTQGTGLDGQTKPICMRHNLSQCTSQKCAFVHCCPVPKCDGTMCGSTDHKAISCPHRSRRVSAQGQLPAPNSAIGVEEPLPKPHCTDYTTELCTQQSRPARAQRTDPTISLDMPSGPTSPFVINGAAVQQ